MKYLIAFVFAFLSFTQAIAGDWTVNVSVASWHPDKYTGTKFDKWNQVNPGIGLQYNLSKDFSIQAGFYKNSEYNTTKHLIAQYQPFHITNTSFGAFIGPGTGYSVSKVIGGLMLQHELDNLVLGVRYIPKISSKQGSAAFGFEVGYNF